MFLRQVRHESHPFFMRCLRSNQQRCFWDRIANTLGIVDCFRTSASATLSIHNTTRICASSECCISGVLVELRMPRFHCHGIVCSAHRYYIEKPLYSWNFLPTLTPLDSPVMAEVALPLHLVISVARDKLLEIGEQRCVNSSTTCKV